jgi:hypothetical protein
MKDRRRSMRAMWVLLFCAAMVGVMGTECSISLIPPPSPEPVFTTVDVELVDNTPDAVDPGLFVDGVAHVFDPPLAPGDSLVVTLDCFAGTTLQTDATLLDSAGAIPSDNVPLLTEGVDYSCGDTVTFVFTQDAFGFFTQVLVNGTLVAP